MPYTPRPSNEILRDMIARVVVRTDLTDLHEGSVLHTLCATVAEQIAEADVRLSQIRDQFTFDGASGSDLDERIEEIGMVRLSATTASGEVTISRTDTASPLTIEVGATFGRSDSDVTYTTTEPYTMAVGVSSLSVTVYAQNTGEGGNAPSRSIDTLLGGLSGITSVAQSLPISNGQDAETDSVLRSRARRYLNSLARCQPSALEYQALTFTASDNTRVSTANVYEDPVVYGRVDLLVDDGSGFGSNYPTRAGASIEQFIGSNGVRVIGTERSIAGTPEVVRVRNFISTPLTEGTDYTVAHGAGTITLLDGAVIPFDTVFVHYSVYTGIVAELQDHIEGEAGDVSSGYRPAGVSVRVMPAPVDRANLDLLLTTADGANLTDVTLQVQAEVSDYFASLGAGDPAYIAQIIDVVMRSDSVKNVVVYRANTNTPAVDIYPATPRTVLRAGAIRAITSTTGA